MLAYALVRVWRRRLTYEAPQEVGAGAVELLLLVEKAEEAVPMTRVSVGLVKGGAVGAKEVEFLHQVRDMQCEDADCA